MDKRREIEVVSFTDRMAGYSGIAISIIIPIIVLVIMGLQLVAADPSTSDKLVYGIGLGAMILYFPFFVMSTKKLFINMMKNIGRKIWNKKHNDGYPVDENKYYKYVDNISYLRDPDNIIVSGQTSMNALKEATWINNMELKQRKYLKVLRKSSRKVNKKIAKMKKKDDQEALIELEAFSAEINVYIEQALEMNNAINDRQLDKIEELDKSLDDRLKIVFTDELFYEDIIHQNLVVENIDGLQRFMEHPIVRKLSLYVTPVLSFAFIGYVLLQYDLDAFDIERDVILYAVSIFAIFAGKTYNILKDAIIEFTLMYRISMRHVDIVKLYNVILVEKQNATEED